MRAMRFSGLQSNLQHPDGFNLDAVGDAAPFSSSVFFGASFEKGGFCQAMLDFICHSCVRCRRAVIFVDRKSSPWLYGM